MSKGQQLIPNLKWVLLTFATENHGHRLGANCCPQLFHTWPVQPGDYHSDHLKLTLHYVKKIRNEMVRPTNQLILTLHHPPIHKSSEQKLITGGVQSTYNVNQSLSIVLLGLNGL